MATQTSVPVLLVYFIVAVVVLMLAWDPPLIGPLAGLDFDWSNWNRSDIRLLPGVNEWPCDVHNKLVSAQTVTLQNAIGPESLAFDSNGGGPYTGVSDGRILRWDEEQRRWLTFGVTSSIRQVPQILYTLLFFLFFLGESILVTWFENVIEAVFENLSWFENMCLRLFY